VASKQQTETIEIPPLTREMATIRIVGTTPMFQHRMAEKAKMTLLVGGRRKTAAERANIKHKPYEEFRNALERAPHGSPTAIGLRAVAVKGAMCSAAVETAGTSKSSTQRLLYLPAELVPLYGVPQIRLDIVRNSDMKKTPDVRSRPFFPRWGAELELAYVRPQLTLTSVITLLANAGMMIGIGDFRQEKGRGAFGCFRVLGDSAEDNTEWEQLVAEGSHEAQTLAIKDPQPANEETAELLGLFAAEARKRS